MPRTETCQACLGTGEIQLPTIREIIRNHQTYSRAQGAQFSIQLMPDHIAELAELLGITDAEIDGEDARPETLFGHSGRPSDTPFPEVSGDAGEV